MGVFLSDLVVYSPGFLNTFPLSISVHWFPSYSSIGLRWVWWEDFLVGCYHWFWDRSRLRQLRLPPQMVGGGGPVGGPSVSFSDFVCWCPHHHLVHLLGGVGGPYGGGGPPHHHPDGLLVGGRGIWSLARTVLI